MQQNPKPGYVTSSDGTRIGYLRQGSGPAIVLVQGAMADVHAYRRFAAALASSWTVISAERRGRGISPLVYSPDHDISRDVDDIDAVMAATGASFLFGLSSGAVIALEATRTLQRVERLVVYEPPFYQNGISREGVARLNSEIEHGDLSSALVDSLLVAGTAPAVVRRAPRPIARVLARVLIALNDRRRGPAATFRELLPGVRYDFHDVAGVDGRIEAFSSIDIPVLLLSGTRSPEFLRQAIRRLAGLLPSAEHVEFDGLGHDGPWNNGDPLLVARAADDFLRRTP